MQTPFQPELLRESFSMLENEAARIISRQAAAASVVTWRYANGDMSIDEPFAKELYGSNAKWRKDGAKPGKSDLRHGFDSEQRLCLVESLEGEYVCHLEHHGSFSLRFDPSPSVRRFDYGEHSLLVSHHILYSGHGQQREYTWENGILQSIELISWNQPFKSVRTTWGNIEVTSHIRQHYVYDDLGLFQIIDRYLAEDGTVDAKIGDSIQYTRIPAGMTLSSLANEIATAIVQETPTLVRNAASSDARYYALLLCYCAEDPAAGWPPFLLLANESILRSKKWSSEEVKYFAWAPDELREMAENVEIPFRESRLLEWCRLHSQIMLGKGVSSMKLALREIVARLREVKWSEIINTTDDFVIAAVDNTGEVDPAKDIKAYAPEEFRRLKQRGLI
jgi:hypothetical protein